MQSTASSPREYMELTPTTFVNSNNEVIDVKVPYNPEQDSQNSYIPNGQTRYCEQLDSTPNSQPDTQIENESGYEMGNSDYSSEVKKTFKLYKSLPKEMFISRLVVLCSSNEVKLDSLRTSLLDVLKEDDDFPYGLQAEPKRRLHTRNGDSVAVKLAHDVHALASVIEGADYSEIKDLFSVGKGSGRQPSVPCTPSRGAKSRDDPSENKVLMQEISMLRAEMLNMKQIHTGAEKLRSEQINSLQKSFTAIKADMQSLTEHVKYNINSIKLGIERIESDKCSGIIQVKNELRTLKNTVKGIQDSVDNFEGLYTNSQGARASKRQKSHQPKASSDQNEHSGGNTLLNNNSKNNNRKSFSAELYTGQIATNYTNNPGLSVAETNVSSDPVSDASCTGQIAETNGYNMNCNEFGDGYRQKDNIDGAEQQTDHISSAAAYGVHATGQYCQVNQPPVAAYQMNMLHGGHQPLHDGFGVSVQQVMPDRVNVAQQQNLHVHVGANMNTNTHNGQSTTLMCGDNQFNGNMNPMQTNSSASYDQVTAGPVSDDAHVGSRQNDDAINDRPYDNDNGLSLADGTVGAKGSVTHKGTELLDVCVEDDDDEDFTEYIRRPPKRFYIGGFTADVSTQKIFRYINKRGPTVTWIRAWPSKRNPNSAIIRLNVVDNHASSILLDKSFWPKGVICRPWKNRQSRYQNAGFRSQQTYMQGRSDFDEYTSEERL